MANQNGSVSTINDRIECNGDFGTIKYIGCVEGHPATWYGIDWDDPKRGKHNGIVNDKVYFKATYTTSGSFVRPEKVRVGQSALIAVTSRYGRKEDAYSDKINQQQLLKLQQEINAPFLQLVGFDGIIDKQSDFYNLKVINLRLQNVSNAGEPGELNKLCPNVEELDISKNLINNWSVIFDICLQLKQLKWLNVSQNRMIIPNNYEEFCFPNLKMLACGAMLLTWDDVLKISTVFPNLEELRVPSNRIKNLDTPQENCFKNLRILDIENNEIGDWNEICKLTTISELNYLIIENSRIKEIRFEECGNQQLDIFKKLRRLVIHNNLISEWKSISELNKLENLEDLRFLSNPVLETESQATRNQLIIAMIATLKILNGTEITSTDRRGAEYDYLKKYGLEWLSVKDDFEKREAFLKQHNRYLELIDKYGVMEESELTVLPNMIKSSLVSVIIEHENRTVVKNLPPSILIQKLVTLVQKLFNLSDRPSLVYVSGTQPDVEIELDDDCKEIGFYSVQEGDRIIAKIH